VKDRFCDVNAVLYDLRHAKNGLHCDDFVNFGYIFQLLISLKNLFFPHLKSKSHLLIISFFPALSCVLCVVLS